MALNFNIVQYLIHEDKYLRYVARKKELQTYHLRYSERGSRDFIPEPLVRKLNIIQLVLGINKYRYWNHKTSKFE